MRLHHWRSIFVVLVACFGTEMRAQTPTAKDAGLPPLPPLPPPSQKSAARPATAKPATPPPAPQNAPFPVRTVPVSELQLPPGFTPPQLLAFDQILKDFTATTNDTTANFTFSLTNISGGPVVVRDVRTSCGCTIANLPSKPWHLPPGTNGQFGVTVDLRGKYGVVAKSVFVESGTSTNGPFNTQTLTVRVTMPPAQNNPVGMAGNERGRNIMIAAADRQAIFRNDCVKCHVEPAVAKTGHALYDAACGVCHDAINRATMVPDLHALDHPTDRDHWIRWITFGRAGSLMAAFAKSEGGPLTDEQIDSLVDYMVTEFPQRARPGVTNQVGTVVKPTAALR
ncbi:MAG: DUF1573 domain-containing protein [Verrucomicrobia bacterium]|nr:DUF1573 domain-containing protein [Verrucomicrobiota bacterium]